MSLTCSLIGHSFEEMEKVFTIATAENEKNNLNVSFPVSKCRRCEYIPCKVILNYETRNITQNTVIPTGEFNIHREIE